MVTFPLPRIDKDEKLKNLLLPYCRLKRGEIWEDPLNHHKVGCLDASKGRKISSFFNSKKAVLALHDPPYNIVAFQLMDVKEFINWSRRWISISEKNMSENSSLYIWLGADQRNHFEPFPEFLMMMRKTGFSSKSFITMRNQRGYGTQKNWMSVRQELLYYTKGEPIFNIEHVYTDIPKVLKGYYKEINGKLTENLERSKSKFIRAGNVWMDIQQVFHLLEENVNGCYAQKPLKAVERIIKVSSNPGDLVTDFFSHAGTTLLAAEKLNRRCFTVDIDPIYCEIAIRRLERFRRKELTGWQNSNPFAEDIIGNRELTEYLEDVYNIGVPQKLNDE